MLFVEEGQAAFVQTVFGDSAVCSPSERIDADLTRWILEVFDPRADAVPGHQASRLLWSRAHWDVRKALCQLSLTEPVTHWVGRHEPFPELLP